MRNRHRQRIGKYLPMPMPIPTFADADSYRCRFHKKMPILADADAD